MMRTPPENREAAKSLISEGISYAMVELVMQGFAILALPVVFLFLSAAEFGVVTWALVVSQVAMTLSTLGLDFSVMRFFYLWPAGERRAVVSGIFGWSFLWSAFLAVAAYAFLRLGLLDDRDRWPSLLGAWAGLSLGLRSIPLALLRVTGSLRSYALIVLSGGLLQALIQVFLVWQGFGSRGYMFGHAAASLATAILAAHMIGAHLGWRPSAWRLPSDVLSFTARVLPSNLLNRFLAVADRALLFRLHSLETLGVYGAASRAATPLKFLGGGLKMAMVPAMSRGEARGERPNELFLDLSRVLLVGILTVASLMALAVWFLQFTPWADRWLDVQRITSLLLLAQVFASLSFLGQLAFYYSSKPQAATVVGIASALVLVAGLFALVPKYGGFGAACAAVLSGLAGFVATAAVTFRQTGRLEPWPELFGLTALLLPCLAAAWFLGASGQLFVYAAASAAFGIGLLSLIRRARGAFRNEEAPTP